MQVRSFQDLEVWKKAHQLVLEIYRSTNHFPGNELFGITAQIRRSSASIPTNLVEGGKRSSRKDYAHFVNMAESSLEETKYHLILSRDLGYLESSQYDALTMLSDEIGRMFYGLRKKLLSF